MGIYTGCYGNIKFDGTKQSNKFIKYIRNQIKNNQGTDWLEVAEIYKDHHNYDEILKVTKHLSEIDGGIFTNQRGYFAHFKGKPVFKKCRCLKGFIDFSFSIKNYEGQIEYFIENFLPQVAVTHEISVLNEESYYNTMDCYNYYE